MRPDPEQNEQTQRPTDDPIERDRLRAWFGELRRADGRRAPPFEQTFRAAAPAGGPRAARHDSTARHSRWAAAAVVLLAAAGVAVALFIARPRPDRAVALPGPPATTPVIGRGPASGPAASLTDWQSPTAWLLDPAATVRPAARAARWPVDLNF